MTTTSYPQDGAARVRRTARPNRAADRAARRRARRAGMRSPSPIAPAGRPMRAALLRVPFVIALIAVLAGGVGGVLYLNTKMDESGMRTEQANAKSAQLRLQIEALGRTIADLSATPRLAQEAKDLGLVPAGDAAILSIGADGAGTLIGTPKPVPAAVHGTAGR